MYNTNVQLQKNLTTEPIQKVISRTDTHYMSKLYDYPNIEILPLLDVSEITNNQSQTSVGLGKLKISIID